MTKQQPAVVPPATEKRQSEVTERMIAFFRDWLNSYPDRYRGSDGWAS